MSTPREEFTQASQQLTRAQARLDADRQHLNTQRRQAARAYPSASQAAQREAYIEQALGAVRRGIALVNEAKQVRTQKYDALLDPTEADGWL
jgi:hypothetical protein